jgi:hypothetical protein
VTIALWRSRSGKKATGGNKSSAIPREKAVSDGYVRNKDFWDYGRKWMIDWLTLRENHDLWWKWWCQTIQDSKGKGLGLRNDARSEAERVPHFLIRVSRSVVAAPKEKRLWRCADCGFECPYWMGSERFSYCTTCEHRRSEEERERIAREAEEVQIVYKSR